MEGILSCHSLNPTGQFTDTAKPVSLIQGQHHHFLEIMRLLSWNIQYGKGGADGHIDLKRIARVIRSRELPDVMGLQEISRWDPNTDSGADQLEQLCQLFPEYQAFYGAALERSGGVDGKLRQFGNLILSRFTPTQVRHLPLTSPADAKACSMPRMLSEVTVEADLGWMRFATTHLEFFSPHQRKAQARRIRELHLEASAQKRQPPQDRPETPFTQVPQSTSMIVCGDFNFLPDSTSYRLLTEAVKAPDHALVDAWKRWQPEAPHPTTCGLHDVEQWPEGSHCRDFFFITNDRVDAVQKIEVDTETTASDHQPVWLELGKS